MFSLTTWKRRGRKPPDLDRKTGLFTPNSEPQKLVWFCQLDALSGAVFGKQVYSS